MKKSVCAFNLNKKSFKHEPSSCLYLLDYTCKNLTTCSKSANKSSKSCVRTSCYKLSTSLEQAVNNLEQPLLILSDLLQGCPNKAVTIMI